MRTTEIGRPPVEGWGVGGRWTDTPHLLLAVSGLTLIAAFVAIGVATGTVWPWSKYVHESGTRTLLGTVFYYEHALRELPLDLLLGAGIGVATHAVSSERLPRQPHVGTVAMWALTAVVTVIAVGTVYSAGWPVFVANLSQAPLRVGSPDAWGQHWQYHVVSRLALLFLALPVAVVVAGRTADFSSRRIRRSVALVYGCFAVATLLFVPTWRSVFDPVFIGHQAREFATHVTVTLPLGTTVAFWTRRARGSTLRFGVSTLMTDSVVRWLALTGFVLGLALVVGAILTNAGSRGQTESVTALVWVHFFEHVSTYLIVALTATSISSLLARAGGKGA